MVVDLDNPLAPRVTAEIGAPALVNPQGIAVQFRYAFVVDQQGLKVLDVTDLAQPQADPGALVPLADARNIYVARTYAYVAGGKQGLAIVNVEQPERPRLDQIFTADGAINDLRDVKIGAVDASVFAYLADGAQRLARAANSLARGFARFLRLQPAAHAEAHRHLSHRRPRARRSRRALTATAPWTRAAINLPSSAAAARGLSTLPRCSASTCATVSSIQLRTTRPARRASQHNLLQPQRCSPRGLTASAKNCDSAAIPATPQTVRLCMPTQR